MVKPLHYSTMKTHTQLLAESHTTVEHFAL